MKKWLGAALAAIVMMPVLVVARSTQAQWPINPLKIIVMWPPGGAADLACRQLQQRLSEVIGQDVMVEKANIKID